MSSNQIAGFFDYHYLYKQSINALDFLQTDYPQGKKTFGTLLLVGFSQKSLNLSRCTRCAFCLYGDYGHIKYSLVK